MKGKYPAESPDIFLDPFESSANVGESNILVLSRSTRKTKNVDAISRRMFLAVDVATGLEYLLNADHNYVFLISNNTGAIVERRLGGSNHKTAPIDPK